MFLTRLDQIIIEETIKECVAKESKDDPRTYSDSAMAEIIHRKGARKITSTHVGYYRQFLKIPGGNHRLHRLLDMPCSK